jgi:hypothetical protein
MSFWVSLVNSLPTPAPTHTSHPLLEMFFFSRFFYQVFLFGTDCMLTHTITSFPFDFRKNNRFFFLRLEGGIVLPVRFK